MARHSHSSRHSRRGRNYHRRFGYPGVVYCGRYWGLCNRFDFNDY